MSEKGTEQATEQRKEKARKKGDIVRSRELLSSMSMLAGILVLGMTAKQFLSAWDEAYVRSLMLGMGDLQSAGVDRGVMQQGMKILMPSILPVGLILAASFGATLLAGVGQSGGLQMSAEALE